MTKPERDKHAEGFPVKRAAFALPATIVVLLAGIALVGVAFRIYSSFSAQSMHQTEQMEEYAILSNAIERGKLHVTEMMDKANPGEAIRGAYYYIAQADPSSKVEKPQDLLLGDTDRAKFEILEGAGATGARSEQYKVEIYVFDTTYLSDDLSPNMTDEVKKLLPARSGIRNDGITREHDRVVSDPDDPPPGTSANKRLGAYLVRAVLTRRDGSTRTNELSFIRLKGD